MTEASLSYGAALAMLSVNSHSNTGNVMGLDSINNRPAQPNPLLDREVAPGAEDIVEEQIEVSFEDARSNMEAMLQMNYGVIHELLGQIAAVSPFRSDSAHGKQPDAAAIDASNDVQSAPVAPVGKSAAAAYNAGLQHVNSALGNHDMQLQKVFDQMALSRSGRKPDLHNHGIEYEQLMTIVNQAQTRLNQLEKMLPESLPGNTGQSLRELMPEFSEALLQYDASFQQIQAMIQENIRQTQSK